MILKETKHQKHANLKRPSTGSFSRNEWSILGTPCGKIKALAFRLTAIMSQKYSVGYVDADHKSGDDEANQGHDKKSAMGWGAKTEYTDKITFHRFDKKTHYDIWQYRQEFNGVDMVIVNGNHFNAKAQIVVIDPKKEESLSRKLDRLTDVHALVVTPEADGLPQFLKDHLANWETIPTFKIDDVSGLSALIEERMKVNRPKLKGLVLAGGKSQRMGHDKGLIDYHGKPQRNYMADQLSEICEEVYFSCREDQVGELGNAYRCLPDKFIGFGPFGGMMTAFLHDPDAAWMVVACDLPLLDNTTLEFLKSKRNISKLATAFQSPVNKFPEPLIAIWEPRSYPILLQFLAQGYSCPRKVLINSEIELVEAENANALKNINNPEQHDEIMDILGKHFT
ncbi:MAG: NTP transferase domain-containing protein [Bacteroidota bacterium]